MTASSLEWQLLGFVFLSKEWQSHQEWRVCWPRTKIHPPPSSSSLLVGGGPRDSSPAAAAAKKWWKTAIEKAGSRAEGVRDVVEIRTGKKVAVVVIQGLCDRCCYPSLPPSLLPQLCHQSCCRRWDCHVMVRRTSWPTREISSYTQTQWSSPGAEFVYDTKHSPHFLRAIFD